MNHADYLERVFLSFLKYFNIDQALWGNYEFPWLIHDKITQNYENALINIHKPSYEDISKIY